MKRFCCFIPFKNIAILRLIILFCTASSAAPEIPQVSEKTAPRTVATLAFAVRRANRSARSHQQTFDSWAMSRYLCWVRSHAPSIRSHRGTIVVWPDSNQWESQKNRLTLIYFGKIQFFPPCIWNITFMSYRLWEVAGVDFQRVVLQHSHLSGCRQLKTWLLQRGKLAFGACLLNVH